MRIRTTLLILSILGALSAASVVWFFLEDKASVVAQSETDLKYDTYSDAWQRLVQVEFDRLEVFLPLGLFHNLVCPSASSCLIDTYY